MDHPKRSAAAAPSLPDDALVEILSCLTAKSLCRFKCVSKTWRDLISDRLRCNKLPQTLAGFFVLDKEEEEEIHDGDSDDGSDVSSDPFVYGRFINTLGRFVPLASFSFLVDPGFQDLRLMHSCNGLLLYGHMRPSDTYHSLGYIVCNPATEQWVAVPPSIWKPRSFLKPYSDDETDEDAHSDYDLNPDKYRYPFTYLIFDPAVSSHFQLIQYVQFMLECEVCVQEVYAYSSQTGVWCQMTDEWSSAAEEVGVYFTESALVNGMLHLSATSFVEGRIHREIIVAVDGEGKKCKVICGPEKRADVVFVGQSQGRLHYMTQHRDSTRKMTELSIWVLQDYDKEEWVLKHSVTVSQLFGEMNCQREFDYTAVTIHPDRNLFFFVQRWDLKLKSYDMDSKEICSLYTLRFPHDIFPYVPYFAESPALTNKH